MSLLSLNALGMTLGAPLFADLSLSVEAGDRLAVVAANGRGKSTLLNLIAGRLDPAEGTIIRSRAATLAVMEQDVPKGLLPLTLAAAVAAALPEEVRDYEGWRADLAMDALAIPEAIRDRPMSSQSGGWQRMAMLARLAVVDADLILMDEPTNHLDLEKILLVERWIADLPRGKALLVVSHDRAFLDRVTDRTLFLRHPESVLFDLPFSAACAALQELDLARERKFDNDMKAVKQLRRQAAKLNNIAINSGSDLLTVKTKQLKARAERIERSAEAAHAERSAGKVVLASAPVEARLLFRIRPLEMRLPNGALLFRSGPLYIGKGDRIALLGRNGTGKSRLMQRIQQAVTAPPGADPAIAMTPSLTVGYMDQALAMLETARSPLAILTGAFCLSEIRARSLLAGAGIAIEKQEKPVDRLSGGQRARLALLTLRLAGPGFFLLDEPTNHLDLEAQDALARELAEEDRAALIVSHDRAFIRETANRFWLIDRRQLIEIESPEDFFDSLAP